MQKKGPKLGFGPSDVFYKLPQIEFKMASFDNLEEAELEMAEYRASNSKDNSKSGSPQKNSSSKPSLESFDLTKGSDKPIINKPLATN